MPVDPGQQPPSAVRPKAKVVDDGFVVVEVDGFAQMTPEQRTWPVYPLVPGGPQDGLPTDPVTGPGTSPSPPG